MKHVLLNNYYIHTKDKMGEAVTKHESSLSTNSYKRLQLKFLIGYLLAASNITWKIYFIIKKKVLSSLKI